MTIYNYYSICDVNKHNLKINDIIILGQIARKVTNVFNDFILLSKKLLIPLNDDFNIKLLFKECDKTKLILDLNKINTNNSINDFMNKK